MDTPPVVLDLSHRDINLITTVLVGILLLEIRVEVVKQMVPGQEVTHLVFKVLCITMLFIDFEIFS